MIWFDNRRLEKELVAGNVSDQDGSKYLLANMIVFVILPYFPGERYLNYSMTIIQFVVDIFITVLLVRVTFDINMNGDNKDYFKRFLGLYFVATIRLGFYIFIVLIIYELTSHFLEGLIVVAKIAKHIVLLILEIGTGITYYFMLKNSFRRVNHKVS